MARPIIVVDPSPRRLDEIFNSDAWSRLKSLGPLEIHRGERGCRPRASKRCCRGEAADRPDRHAESAPRPRAEAARDRQRRDQFPPERRLRDLLRAGIHVYAEFGLRPAGRRMALGMAIDLCRGITAADRAMRAGKEKWLLDGAEGCFSLYGQPVGLIGFGDLARAFTPLLAPFGCPIKAYDPWVSDHFMAGFGVAAAPLDEVLSTSRGHRGVRRRHQREPGFPRRARIRARPARFGRAADEPGRRRRLPSLPARCRNGRFRAATDVFPVEPAPASEPARRVEGLTLSPHRAGALPIRCWRSAADCRRRRVILRGLPPLSCRRAQRETVTRSRSKPMEKS